MWVIAQLLREFTYLLKDERSVIVLTREDALDEHATAFLSKVT